MHFLIVLDRQLTLIFNSLLPRTSGVAEVIYYLTEQYALTLLLIMFGLVYTIKRKRSFRFFMVYLVGLVSSVSLVELLLKPLFSRERPFLTLGQITTIGELPHSFSFPSGHAAVSATAASILQWFEKRFAWWFWLLAILIALSRVYLGVHYIADITMGLVTGLALGNSVVWSALTLRKEIRQQRATQQQNQPPTHQKVALKNHKPARSRS